jgi:hypothetical protein
MKVCVVGSLNMDMVTQTDVLPKMGETVMGTGFAVSPGGEGCKPGGRRGEAGLGGYNARLRRG